MKKLLLSAVAIVLLIPVYTTCGEALSYLSFCLYGATNISQAKTCYKNAGVNPPAIITYGHAE